MQRLRIKFSREPEVKFISHLDIIRLWQRALTRADIPLAYSEGFNPHPRISLALPLSLGVTSEAELMDLFLSRVVAPHYFTTALGQQLPSGIKILGASPVGLNLPSLQAAVHFVEYRVAVETEWGKEEIESKLYGLLDMATLPWEHQRDTGPHKYDLRALIDDLWLMEWNRGCASIGMRLRCGSGGTGRPEQVIAALGFPQRPTEIHRTKIMLEMNPAGQDNGKQVREKEY